MTLAIWPPELPFPTRGSYQFSTGEGRLRSRNDAGPVRQRRRFSSVVNTVDMTFILTADQWARLQRFYDEELAQGEMPFVQPDFSRDGWPLSDENGAVLTTETGAAILIAATHIVQFGEGLPNATPLGVGWSVAMRLEILP
jgi:hypothetical protein